MGPRVRSALLAAATLAAGAAGEPADAPELLVTLEVSGGPLPTGFVASALPTRFVLFEDGQVFVGGISQLAAGHLDKTEVKAFCLLSGRQASLYQKTVDELESVYRERSLLKRSVYPEDVAEAVAFFASERSAKSTGNILNVDAGNATAFTR